MLFSASDLTLHPARPRVYEPAKGGAQTTSQSDPSKDLTLRICQEPSSKSLGGFHLLPCLPTRLSDLAMPKIYSTQPSRPASKLCRPPVRSRSMASLSRSCEAAVSRLRSRSSLYGRYRKSQARVGNPLSVAQARVRNSLIVVTLISSKASGPAEHAGI